MEIKNTFSDYGWTFGELDGRVYIPLRSDKKSLALRGYALLQSPKGGSQIPFYYVRLVFVLEDAPEFARDLPEIEWANERDRVSIAHMLNDSAKAVRDAVSSRVGAGREMNLHYDHPILMLQHMIWHEGYYLT